MDSEELKFAVQVAALQALDADVFRRMSADLHDGSYLELEEVRSAAVELSPDQLCVEGEGVDKVAGVFSGALLELGEQRGDRRWTGSIQGRIGEIVTHEWEHWRAKPQRLRMERGVHVVFYETYDSSNGFVLHCCGVGLVKGATPAVAAWVQTAPSKLSEGDILGARGNVALTRNEKLRDLIEERIASRGRW